MIIITHDLVAGTQATICGPIVLKGFALANAGFDRNTSRESWSLPNTAHTPADRELISRIQTTLIRSGLTVRVNIEPWTSPSDDARTAHRVQPRHPSGHYRLAEFQPRDLICYSQPDSSTLNWARVATHGTRTVVAYAINFPAARILLPAFRVLEVRRRPSRANTTAAFTRSA
ncbi:hypothetical protein ACFV1N_47985 [Streptosporangium canum]|uniref:hypothetical protein n=1 Tax=Streptosporangium canum TaxID=324952 RepID=UPI0036927266